MNDISKTLDLSNEVNDECHLQRWDKNKVELG